MILVLGGTTEAKELIQLLIQENTPAIISTAYDFAHEFIPDNPLIKRISGKLDCEGLQALIADESVTVVIDATHPYATEISKNASQACENTGIRYIRLEREFSGNAFYEKAHRVRSYKEAMILACNLGHVVFLAIGSSNANAVHEVAEERDAKLYIRALPGEQSIKKCLDAGFSQDEIITGVGPFSYEQNYELWKKLGVDVVITKDSGTAGGYPEKLNAAKELGIDLVVVERPISSGRVARSVEEALELLDG